MVHFISGLLPIRYVHRQLKRLILWIENLVRSQHALLFSIYYSKSTCISLDCVENAFFHWHRIFGGPNTNDIWYVCCHFSLPPKPSHRCSINSSARLRCVHLAIWFHCWGLNFSVFIVSHFGVYTFNESLIHIRWRLCFSHSLFKLSPLDKLLHRGAFVFRISFQFYNSLSSYWFSCTVKRHQAFIDESRVERRKKKRKKKHKKQKCKRRIKSVEARTLCLSVYITNVQLNPFPFMECHQTAPILDSDRSQGVWWHFLCT